MSELRTRVIRLAATFPEGESRRMLLATLEPLKVASDVIDIEAILLSEGLEDLGSRQGKAGKQFGLPGLARVIAVGQRPDALGRRDVMANAFRAMISREDQVRKPQTSWNLIKSKNQAGVSEPLIRKWAKWARAGKTTKFVLQAAREAYQKAVEAGEEHPIGWGLGEIL